MNITNVAISDDPAIEKLFMYHRTGSKAVREVSAPEGATVKDAIRIKTKEE